ncbi:cell division protein FtsW (lipid II flippase) [Clostridium tetanomorphum]|uniref:FtsW/RodA/SpoVE family cell cycle protein n=1 Tax=Clostridium tetanomorphum TaxID=1553 RepID=A0A923J187_CLOTT|nr:FtsW/RodA/SpoVE family cell cycle protein [Clostridium tetanomorphum]KAJ53204.1 cell cycle-related membrane protein [Clostridium tetanomorphum DSM 665]MBC2397510.1 FtsW/RodA/SpoVE family cell cycle protein [Clostridium tetanomorphum]MBP1863606.1 cell division protein FtsW (lipid II flippase) [Clostridium tetanomorphum]NRS86182.1 cell division protein FtsW (lipid II flippase) [Clostridium tetanomorphum]NRZ95739.1 cell division protein FtsW (lipid II flippase) [Clostridium tetanomorphum]
MDTSRDEKKLLRYTYLLCLVGFLNLAILKQPFDKGAMLMSLITCLLIGYSYFVIRKFFSDGDKYIFIFSSILAVIGIIMLYRIDTSVSIKQIIWFAIGVTSFILIVVLFPDLKKFSRYKYIYLVLTLILMSMGSLLAKDTFGSKNWVSIAGFTFQPSEFGKLSLVAYLACALKDYKSFKNLIEPAAVVMVSLGFMVLQRDLGSALIFFGISITMLYIATSKIKYITTCFGLFGIGAFISYGLFDHVKLRFLIWKNPWPYATTKSYQIVQSLLAIASGGLTGSGLGRGYPNYVPVRTTDFIFSIICEELGILMGFAILLLYFLLFYRCMRAAIYADDNFSRLITVGYSAMIACQVLVIVGGVINMIPLTGITLPLVSYGGSSMLSTFFALGVIQKISEEGR